MLSLQAFHRVQSVIGDIKVGSDHESQAQPWLTSATTLNMFKVRAAHAVDQTSSQL